MATLLQQLQQSGVKPEGKSLKDKMREAGIRPVTVPKTETVPRDFSLMGGIEKFAAGTEKILGPASRLLFGTTGEAVGSLGGAGIEALLGKKGPLTAAAEKRFGTPLATTGAIAGTALELLPGGALLGGLKKLPLVGKAAEGLKGIAKKQYLKALAPTTKELKAQAERVVPGLIEKGITFWSTKGIAREATTKADEVAYAIDEAMAALPKETKLNTGIIIDALDKLKDKYRISTEAGTLIDVDRTAIGQIDELINITNQIAPEGKVAPSSLRKLRQIWDKHFKLSKGLDDITGYKKQAERAGADAIRKVFAMESPDIAKLNAEYSFWAGVRNVSEATSKRLAGQQEFGKGVLATGAAVAGAQIAGLKGALAGMMTTIMRNPKWRTVSAVEKNKLADFLMSGEINNARSIIIQIGRNLGVNFIEEIIKTTKAD